MKCTNCGNEIQNNIKFCNYCGTEVIKKSNKNVIKIIIICFTIIIVLILGFLIGNLFINKVSGTKTKKIVDNNSDDINTSYIKNDIDVSKLNIKAGDEISKNIEVVKMIYDKEEFNHRLYILLKNNNNIPVSFDCFLNYYDKNKKRVDRTIEYGYVNPGKYYVAVLNNMTKEKYSSTGIEISAKKVKSYMHIFDIDSSSLNPIIEDDSIKVSYQNNYDNDISIYYGILYYKNNELVFFDHSFATGIKKGDYGNGSFSIYRIPGYSYNKKASDYYDKYEVIVSGATYKDSTY